MENKKNNSSSFDFIIVGQGIAGSVMSLSLKRDDYSVCVIDEPQLSQSSKVAAGIWNPVVFKRLTKSWLADELVPSLISFYEFVEKETHVSLISHRHIIKPFTEEQEKNLWLKKSENENQFLDTSVYADLNLTKDQVIKSYSKVLRTGNLDVQAFLNATQKYLLQHATYLNEKFDHTQLFIEADHVNYKEINAKQIIFCEGHLIQHNPLFYWVPMKPAKGETLTIYCEDLLLQNDVLNKGIFILPLGNHTYKVGATYEWQDLNDTPTEKGRTELEQKLKAIIQTPYTVLKHEAGVRPATIDRRPVIGPHPEHAIVFCFNGFGTKAVMLAPYFATKLIGSIKDLSIVDPEVSPARFWK